MGRSDIKSEKMWEIYHELIHRFEHLDVDLIKKLQVYLDLLDGVNVVGLEPPIEMDLHSGPENPGGRG